MIATYNNGPILEKCLVYLANLDPQPMWYIILENNSQDSTMDVLKSWISRHQNTILIRLWFTPDAVQKLGNPYATIGLARYFLLKKARQLRVDHAISIDDDMFIADTDFIRRITGWGLDLVGGAYLRVYPNGLFLASKWWNIGENRNKYPYTLKSKCSGLNRVAMTSGGCMCISRKLMNEKDVDFYPILDPKQFGDTSEDYGYCLKAMIHGYDCYVDGTLKIGHNIRRRNYKPWCAHPTKKPTDPTQGEYIEFKYGKEKQLIQGRTNNSVMDRLINGEL